MWGGWTSLKSQTMNIWGLCSRNCLREKDTPLTTPTTGLAGRLWVTDHILRVSNFTCLTAELNSLLFPSAHTGGVCPYRLWSICSHEREPSSQRPTLTAPTNQKPGTSGWAMGTRLLLAMLWSSEWTHGALQPETPFTLCMMISLPSKAYVHAVTIGCAMQVLFEHLCIFKCWKISLKASGQIYPSHLCLRVFGFTVRFRYCR